MQEYYPLVTKYGEQKEIDCLAGKCDFDIEEIAVGDGNGSLYEPEAEQTALKNEVWRGKIDKIDTETNPDGSKTLFALVHIPANVGGFTIREAGVFDRQNKLVIAAKMPETVKRLPETGDIKQLSIRVDLSILNAVTLPFLVDPSINTATVEYCDKHYQNLNEKGEPSGYAPLDETGLVPEVHLPVSKDFADKDLSNLTPEGESKFSNSSYSTCCFNSGIASESITLQGADGTNPAYHYGNSGYINYNITQSFTWTKSGTYTLNVEEEGDYTLEAVSGGGQGAHTDGGRDQYSDTGWAWHDYKCGGTGAYFKGKVHLTAGEHTIKINPNVNGIGGRGGSVSIDDGFVLTGGMNGKPAGSNFCSTPAYGGTLSVDTIVVETMHYSAGITGYHLGGFKDQDRRSYSNVTAPVSSSSQNLTGYGYGGGTSNGADVGGGGCYFKIASPAGQSLDFKVGLDSPLTGTMPDGKRVTFVTIPPISGERIFTSAKDAQGSATGDIDRKLIRVYIDENGELEWFYADNSADVKYLPAVGNKPPVNPALNDTWIDTTCAPYTILKYNGEKWEIFNKLYLGSWFYYTTESTGSVYSPPYNWVDRVINGVSVQ